MRENERILNKIIIKAALLVFLSMVCFVKSGNAQYSEQEIYKIVSRSVLANIIRTSNSQPYNFSDSQLNELLEDYEKKKHLMAVKKLPIISDKFEGYQFFEFENRGVIEFFDSTSNTVDLLTSSARGDETGAILVASNLKEDLVIIFSGACLNDKISMYFNFKLSDKNVREFLNLKLYSYNFDKAIKIRNKRKVWKIDFLTKQGVLFRVLIPKSDIDNIKVEYIGKHP